MIVKNAVCFQVSQLVVLLLLHGGRFETDASKTSSSGGGELFILLWGEKSQCITFSVKTVAAEVVISYSSSIIKLSEGYNNGETETKLYYY